MADTGQIETKLCEQVSELIVADIKSGKIDSSRRLPGYRVLAAQYGVSWGTVIEALNLLEVNSVIQRRSRSGTYISPRYLDSFKKTQVIAFVFPEKSISRSVLNAEVWGITSEVYHGMIDEAARNNARVEFKYMEDTDDEIILGQQMRQLQDVNGVVMVGRQLKNLRKRIQDSGKRTVVIYSYFEGADESATPCVALSMAQTIRKMGQFICDSGYRSITLINGQLNMDDWAKKEKLLLEYLKPRGIIVSEKYNTRSPNADMAEAKTNAKKILKEATGELYCCFETDMLMVLFKEALSSSRVPGRDFDMVGLASGISFANYYPHISYFKLPYFELGQAACNVVLGKEYKNTLEIEFIKGQTTEQKQLKEKEMYV
jgi:DNA-binding LacI/PurR family transcriptional regulator